MEECTNALKAFLDLLADIGLPLSADKTVGPTQVITFLGVELSTIELMASLPSDKIVQYIDEIEHFLCLEKATLKQVQAVIGQLQWANAVVVPGRPFLR